ncbi:MAG: PCMD domain-containing protein [Prevotellaceae bacterium]|jgi:hypothetical protein|nr:PCMD domain-containing protein [Prevotellaceae bacterium]
MGQLKYIFGHRGMFGLKRIILILPLALLCGACTKVMELSDDARLTDFIIKSVTPEDIQLGTPVIIGDTVRIPVLRGITLFPMSISAEPVCSPETEQAVVSGSSLPSFPSFNEITFDLGAIHFNSFYLIAKSGLPKPYFIKLDIDDQKDRNDFKQFDITEFPQNSLLAAKGFVNPIKRTVTLYGFDVRFPLDITACATLSDSAYIKDAHNVVDAKALHLSFAKYGDSIEYSVEAENGDARQWKVFLKQTEEITGTETSDILSAVSLDAKKQSAEVRSGGYRIKGIGVDDKAGNLILVVSPTTKSLSSIEIAATLTTRSNSQIVGYTSGENIFFENEQSTKDFIVLDSRTGLFRKWKFVLMEGDVGDIYAFPFIYSSKNNDIRIDENATVIDNISRQIKLQVTTCTDLPYWPLTVTAGEIEHSEGATVEIDPLVFNNINDSAYFYLVSSLGTQSRWKVSLIPPQTSAPADIDSVKVNASSYPDLTDRDVRVSKDTAEVLIGLKDKNALPIRIQPYLYISDGAEFETFQNGDFMEFKTFSDTVKVGIVSRSGQKKTWKFVLLEKSQLQNSNFELWIESGIPTIDPVPGKGRGWATANNIMVQGTKRVDNGTDGFAAEMTTNIISMPKNLITSATLFLGYFDMSTISLDKPRSMTKFGVPFEARPIAFKIDAKYTPGDNYQKSRLVSGSGISAQYVLDDLEGEDRGQIYAELIHWSGEGELNYTGEPTAGVHVLARGEYVTAGKSEWTRQRILLERKPEYEQYQPTHLIFVAASSIDGHLFTGAKGSKLTVDNFELIY